MPKSNIANIGLFLALRKGSILPGAAAVIVLAAFFFSQSVSAFKSFDGFLGNKGQGPQIQIQAFVSQEAVRPGERFRIYVRVTIGENWHIYSMKALDENGSLNTKILFSQNVFKPEEEWRESPPTLIMDGALQKTVNTHKGMAEFNRLHSAPTHLKPGIYAISGSLLFRACDNKICALQREKPFRTQIKILGKV